LSAAAGRFGGAALRINQTGTSTGLNIRKTGLANFATGSLHWPMTLSQYPAVRLELASFWDGATQQVSFCLNAAGTISIMRGGAGGTVLATSTFVPSLNVYYLYELKVTFATGTGGTIELRCYGPGAPSNGIIIASTGSLNTSASGNAFSNGFQAGGSSTTNTGQTTDYEHMILIDDFIGDKRYYTNLPSAAVATQWTPNASTNLSRINEAQEDGDTTYNSDSTAGHEDSYSYAATIAGLTGIVTVILSIWWRKDDAGARQTKQRAKSSGIYADGATVNLSTTYAETLDAFPNDPNTSAAWTKTGVDAMNGAYNLVA
jgi:hypothetical protein